jgi:hypothetical protein
MGDPAEKVEKARGKGTGRYAIAGAEAGQEQRAADQEAAIQDLAARVTALETAADSSGVTL